MKNERTAPVRGVPVLSSFILHPSSFTTWGPYLLLWGCWSLMLVLWQALDRQPPIWDMAYHWTRAHRIHQALADGGKGLLAPLAGYYPPLFSCALGLLEFVLPYPWPLIALHSLAVLAAALGYARLYRGAARPEYGWLAFGFLLATPLMVWLSHEALIEVILTLWVFGSFTLLLATHGFADRTRSLWLGLALGLGLLVKWTFAFFLFFPVAWTLLEIARAPEKVSTVSRRRRLGHALAAGLLALAVAVPWYVCNLKNLRAGVATTLSDSVAEGDPQTIGWDWLTFYPRLFLSYGLQLPLLLILACGIWAVLRERLARRQIAKRAHNGHEDRALLLLISCLGPYLIFQFISNKDVRYLMPLLPWLSLLAGRALDLIPAAQRRTAATVGSVLTLLLASAYFFAPSWIRASITLKRLDTTIYQERILRPQAGGWEETMAPTHHVWALWNTGYLGIVGAPVRRDGTSDFEHVSRQLDELLPPDAPVVVGVMPDQPRLSVYNLQEEATRRHRPWTFVRLYEPLSPASDMTYIIGIYGNQGVSWTTWANQTLLDWLANNPTFEVVRRWPGEAGEWIIWKKRSS